MKRVFLTLMLLLCGTPAAWAATVYLDQVPGGNCINTYSIASRNCSGTGVTSYSSLVTAKGAISGGDTISVRGGTHTYSTRVFLDTAAGSAGNLTKLWATPGETPILNGASMGAGETDNHFLHLSANFWHIKGLEITNTARAGIYVTGTNAIIENNNVHHCVRLSSQGAGIQIDPGATNALILNNDSHHNTYQGTGTGGDGIEIGIGTSTGVVVRGNRTWRNHDDGVDLSNSKVLVTVDHNWSWENGFDDSLAVQGGNGAGFKMGLVTGDGGFLVYQNLAWNNVEDGWNCNSATVPSTFWNNTGYGNNRSGMFNFNFWCNTSDILRNNLSGNPNTAITSTGSNPVVHDHNSWDASPSVTVTTADFVSLDFSAFPTSRQADGSLPVVTFLHLVAGSDLIDKGVNVGLPFTGSLPDLGAFEFAAAADPCTPSAVVMTGVTSDTGFAWITPESANRFGDPADASATPTQSTLRLFENGIELGPQHSAHADIRTIGLGKFSHFSGDAQATQYLLWSASDNTNVTTNGRAYTYTVDCVPVRALYHLDEASGTTAADSVGTFPGTLVNTPTWIAGKVNGALSLNGSTQYVSATSPNLTGAVTLAAWVRADSLAADYQTLLANFGATGSNDFQFDLSVTGGAASQGVGAFFYGYRLGANTRQFFSAANSITVAAGWLHLAVTDDGADTIQLYLNGSPVADTPNGTATSKPTSAPGILALGRAGGLNVQYFNGDLDEVYLFDSALSPAQIAALAAIGADTTAPGPPTNLRVVSP